MLDRLDLLALKFKSRTGTPDGVLLTVGGGLGDAVMLAHVLPRFLSLRRPGERATVAMRRDAAKMAFLFPKDVAVETVDYGRFLKSGSYRRKIMAQLHAAHYRVAVSVDYLRHPRIDDILIAAAAAPESAAMEPRSWPKHDRALQTNRKLYARLFDSGPPLTDKIVRWARFAAWLTGVDAPPPVALFPIDVLPPPAATERSTVIMQPFSAVPEKQSPPGLWRKIIETLPSSTTAVVAGAPTDLERNPAFRALLDLPNVVFDGSTFQGIVPLLRAARLVVSVDTAMMHLAVAVGAPTLCLASAAYVGEIVPYDPVVAPPNMHVVYHDMPCRGCLGACVLPKENGMFPCVARLDETSVLGKVKTLLTSQ